SLAYWMTRSPLNVLWVQLCQLNLMERFHPTVELGRAYAAHGFAMGIAFPKLGRGAAYAERGAVVGESLSDLWVKAQTLTSKAVALLAASRLDQAIELSR